MTFRPINEDDLNGFVDQRLDAARHAEVIAYLDSHPDVARRVAGYREQRDQLRDAFGAVAEEPIPPELDLSRMIADRQLPRPASRWPTAVAATILLTFGVASGWIAHDMALPSPTGVKAVAQEAVASYMAYGSDQFRPVEIRATERDALAEWAATQLSHPVSIPDLTASGYRFMGGRVVPTNHGPAAMFMYDDDKGTRVVMLARPMITEPDMPMTRYSDGDVNGYAWSDGGLGYGLVGPMEPATLHPIANEMRRQITNNA